MLEGLTRALALITICIATLVPTMALARRTIDVQGPNDPNHAYCDIVVKQRGGNPTQDMTGSIGHAKSHQSNGGRANPLICYLPGTR